MREKLEGWEHELEHQINFASALQHLPGAGPIQTHTSWWLHTLNLRYVLILRWDVGYPLYFLQAARSLHWQRQRVCLDRFQVPRIPPFLLEFAPVFLCPTLLLNFLCLRIYLADISKSSHRKELLSGSGTIRRWFSDEIIRWYGSSRWRRDHNPAVQNGNTDLIGRLFARMVFDVRQILKSNGNKDDLVWKPRPWRPKRQFKMKKLKTVIWDGVSAYHDAMLDFGV